MTTSLQQHYTCLFREYGDSPQAVQYHDAISQRKRFRVLSEVSQTLGSVVDLGCGLGHFCDYLRESSFHGKYLGLDFVQEFINVACSTHAEDRLTQFRQFDLHENAFPPNFDTFVVCGVFNNKMPDNQRFMESTLTKAYEAARKHVAFNVMSTYVDFQDDTLFYTDPREVFDFCKRNLTRRVTLRNDYLVREDRPPYEYTVYLYK